MSPLLLVLAALFLVMAWVGGGAAPRAQLALWWSALLVSAATFLPLEGLRAVVSRPRLRDARAPGTSADWGRRHIGIARFAIRPR